MHAYALEKIQKNDKFKHIESRFINDWVIKVLNKVNDRFQLEEVIYFVTAEEILKGIVNLNPDRSSMIQQFHSVTVSENSSLQTPEETFGKRLLSPQCIKCKGYNTISMQRQARSIDEPGRTDFQCLDRCGHAWSIK
jgi:DNA-directed RNA polymerase subunit M/transcription elongation factor TFIIS